MQNSGWAPAFESSEANASDFGGEGGLEANFSLSKEDEEELQRGWRERMKWAGCWLLDTGQARRNPHRCEKTVRDRLIAAGVEGAANFSEAAGKLLLAWGEREWETMVLEVSRLQGTDQPEGHLTAIEWPTKQQVAESVAGFMSQRVPGWELAVRWRGWRRNSAAGSNQG